MDPKNIQMATKVLNKTTQFRSFSLDNNKFTNFVILLIFFQFNLSLILSMRININRRIINL